MNALKKLIKSLNDAQRQAAIYDTNAPKEMITANKQKVLPLATAGLAAAQMTKEQKENLFGAAQYAKR